MRSNANTTHLAAPSLRILVAENALSPQTNIIPMLEKLGHLVVRADRDRQILTEAMEQHFDLVFIDDQFPVVQSAGAIEAIRAHEILIGGHVPIIAMSQHAISAGRKQCLAAGMDRYISRPINMVEFETVLQAFSDPDSIHPTEPPTQWNRTDALERAGGNEESLFGLIEVFTDEKPRLLVEMNRALLARQPDLLECAALKLGEELSYLGVLELSRAARQLALLAKNREFGKATELAVALQSHLFQMDAVMAGDLE